MPTLLGSFLDPFSTDDEPEDWLVLRLVVRTLGAFWVCCGILLATTYRFVRLLTGGSTAN